MTCSSPFEVKVGGVLRRLVPCGRCRGCRIARSTEWATRIMHEVGYWPASSFLTLTYDDEHLPSDLSVDRTELARFWKKLRSATAAKLRYFACGEYGGRKGRPHYHAIVFGAGASAYWRDALVSSWGNGFCYVGSVSHDSARYVADYIGAGFTGGKGPVRMKDGRVRPFVTMSKGIGRSWVDAHAAQLVDDPRLLVRGVAVGVPRYYLKVLRRGGADVRMRVDDALDVVRSERQREVYAFHRERSDGSVLGIRDSMAASAVQRGKNREARDALRRGKV